jgi:7-cyano-7-deazaguanine synthase in queuosine biosynthesis
LIVLSCEGHPSLRVSANPSSIVSYSSTVNMSFGERLTKVEARDLLRVGQAAFIADRAFRRSMRTGQWTRRIGVMLPVEEPATWKRLAGRVAALASFVTHDKWEFDFVQERRTRRDHRVRRSRVPDITVNLFSGGLDSLCGAAHSVEHDRQAVFVSHSPPSAGKARAVIADVARGLKAEHHRAEFANFRFTLSQVDAYGNRSLFPERTRRTRPLLFLSMAGSTALELGASTIRMYENGVLAINLPFGKGFHGPRISRHAHPETLRLFEDLLRALVRSSDGPSVVNPFFTKTKGEEALILRGAARLADTTISCENAGQQVARLKHWLRIHGRPHAKVRACGLCFPCLIRRAALHRADIVDRSWHYGFDVRDVIARPRRNRLFPGFERLRNNVNDLETFCRRLQELAPANFVMDYFSELSLLSRDPGSAATTAQQTFELYQRFAAEVLGYLGD